MTVFKLKPIRNKENYMLPASENGRLTLRLAQFSASFDGRYSPLFYDMFGFLDDYNRLFLPVEDDTDLLNACLERAKELNGCNLMFSGGVDSTFLLACFKYVGADVNLVNYCPNGIKLIPELRKKVEDEFAVHYVSEAINVSKFKKVYLGSLSDSFFFSSHRLKGEKEMRWCKEEDRGYYDISFKDMKFIPLEDMMLKTKSFSHDEIELCLAYSCLLDRSLRNNKQIARFIDWTTCLPKHMLQASWGYFVGMDSFFNTQKFADIAYTQYWDSNLAEYHDKKIFKEFISDVFGTDFGVEKNYT